MREPRGAGQPSASYWFKDYLVACVNWSFAVLKNQEMTVVFRFTVACLSFLHLRRVDEYFAASDHVTKWNALFA